MDFGPSRSVATLLFTPSVATIEGSIATAGIDTRILVQGSSSMLVQDSQLIQMDSIFTEVLYKFSEDTK